VANPKARTNNKTGGEPVFLLVRAVRDKNHEKRVRPGGEADESMSVSEASDDAAAKPILKRVPIERPSRWTFFLFQNQKSGSDEPDFLVVADGIRI
ncbi:MAG: hypothetical protein J6N45_00085, partial [Alphaproteobacteria bacterium]|nr:hypothetical protein [Alphaproteobacteria bacterium]